MTAHEGPLLYAAVGDISVIDCQGCHFAHIVPLPDPAALRRYYSASYYVDAKPNYLSEAERDAGWWQLVYAERYTELAHWVTSGGRQILDVGSGPGYFLAEGRRRGWEGIGLEPSEVARTYSQKRLGLTVFDSEFDEAAAEQWHDFDAVNMGEVLEHVPDPADMLGRAYRVLKPGGVVCVIVPNDFNAIQHALVAAGQQDAWWVVPSQHLNYFCAGTLHQLMRRCGFSVADVTCTFPLELFLVAGQNYVGHPEVGAEVHAWRKRLEMGLELLGLGELKREAYRTLARRGMGRDIVMYGKRLKASEVTS